MKAGGGKRKGSNFERLICHKLTMWLTGQEDEYYFYRSPSSGAVATMCEMNKDITGDIISVKPEGRILTDKFSIECKDGYAEADPLKIFKNNKNDIIKDFWQQCMDDAKKSHKNGMLIFRKKGHPILIGIEDNIKLCTTMKSKIATHLVISFDSNLPKLTLFELDIFLSNLNNKKI